MPIYEYQCGACEHEFEKLMKMSAPDPACPACGQESAGRKVSGTSFHLKGSGWYSDHYGIKEGGTKGGSSEGT